MDNKPIPPDPPSFEVQTASHQTITVSYQVSPANIGQAKALAHALAHAHGGGYNGYTPEVILSHYGMVGTRKKLKKLQRWIFEGTGVS